MTRSSRISQTCMGWWFLQILSLKFWRANKKKSISSDDFKVTVTPTNIIQSNEYYPFGSQTANSWTRDNSVANNFLANGGTELNTTSSLYDLEFRNYDPILGRMHQ